MAVRMGLILATCLIDVMKILMLLRIQGPELRSLFQDRPTYPEIVGSLPKFLNTIQTLGSLLNLHDVVRDSLPKAQALSMHPRYYKAAGSVQQKAAGLHLFDQVLAMGSVSVHGLRRLVLIQIRF